MDHLLQKLRKTFDFSDRNHKFKYEDLKISVIYLLIGLFWIYFSDRMVFWFFSDDQIRLMLNTYKGFFYVFTTAVILYLLVHKLLRKVNAAEKKLSETNRKLSASNTELQAYVEEMVASEEELKSQYDQILEYDKKLSVSEEKYKGLIHEMQLGVMLYEGSAEENITDCRLADANLFLELLTGYRKEEILGKLFTQIQAGFSDSQTESLNRCFHTGVPVRFETYLKAADRYAELIAYKPNAGQIALVLNDVTKRKLAEQQLQISENNFRNVFEYSADAILLLNQKTIINCNSAASAMLGYPDRSALMGRSILSFSPECQPDGKKSEDILNGIFRICDQRGNCRFEWWHQKQNGELIPTEVVVTTIQLKEQNIYHALCRDISERKVLEEKLQFLGLHDQLTGLYNRRFFEQELLRLDQECYYPLAVTMADINGLKLINDSFGHPAGDEYIVKVAGVLKAGSGEKDIVCRLAGDEFIILSPNRETEEILQMIRKMSELAAEETVHSINISISYGYATKTSEQETMVEVLKKAEDFMYTRKLFESPSMRGKTINTIIATLHEKNPREEQHSHRVAVLCERLGREIGMSADEVKELKTVGLLHDIGKIAINEEILNKNGRLTEAEREEINKHPEIGYRILSTVNELSEMATYVLAHHERWDGKGYPRGLKGKEIPKQSLIIAIADSYDAMVSERSYRKALPREYALSELEKGAGTQFYAAYVDVFIHKVINNPDLEAF